MCFTTCLFLWCCSEQPSTGTLLAPPAPSDNVLNSAAYDRGFLIKPIKLRLSPTMNNTVTVNGMLFNGVAGTVPNEHNLSSVTSQTNHRYALISKRTDIPEGWSYIALFDGSHGYVPSNTIVKSQNIVERRTLAGDNLIYSAPSTNSVALGNFSTAQSVIVLSNNIPALGNEGNLWSHVITYTYIEGYAPTNTILTGTLINAQ